VRQVDTVRFAFEMNVKQHHIRFLFHEQRFGIGGIGGYAYQFIPKALNLVTQQTSLDHVVFDGENTDRGHETRANVGSERVAANRA
jgi:hypothetical protein